MSEAESSRRPRPSSGHVRCVSSGGLVALLAIGLSPACADPAPGTPPTPYLDGPLCASLVSDEAPDVLFDHELVPIGAVDSAYPYGDMQPDQVQEIINFEQGFYIRNSPEFANVPLTAPTTLYVRSIEVTRHDADHDGTVELTDYGFTYDVCSRIVEGERGPAVSGNFAHLKSLAPSIATVFGTEADRIRSGAIAESESALRCSNGIDGPGTCTFFVSLAREEDPTFSLVVPAGDPIGTTAFPGFDANVRDRRKNGGLGNHFLSRDRWTAETGHASGLRYGVCTYEYFVEPYRTQYLRRIGANGVYRNVDGNGLPVAVEHPCGLFEADLGAGGTAAGYWMESSRAALHMTEDMSIEATEEVLSGMLVLSEHFLEPNAKLAMSTHLAALSGGGNDARPMVVEFARGAPDGTNTNVPFDEVVPGTVYCYVGAGYSNALSRFSFLLEIVDAPVPTLRIERLEGAPDCSTYPPYKRTFGPSVLTFVR